MLATRLARTAARRPLVAAAAKSQQQQARSFHAATASARRYDQKKADADRQAADDLFHSNAETLNRLLPREFAKAQADDAEATALLKRAEEAAAARDTKALDGVQKDVFASVDETYSQLLEEHRRMGSVPRTDFREKEWAQKALQEGRTTEAYGLHPDAGAIGSAGVLEKYGVSTVAGFAAAIAVAKGVYLPTEETLVVACFSGFVATAYVALREQTAADLEEQSGEMLKEHQTAVDRYIGALRTARDFYADSKLVANQLTEVAKYYRDLERRFIESRPRYFKSVAVRDIEQRLARFHAMESNLVSQFPVQIADSINEVVTFVLKRLPDRVKSYDVDASIARIAGDRKAGQKDLVRMAYERAVGRVINRWAALRDRELAVPEDVRAAWQKTLDADTTFAKVEDPSKMDVEGMVLNADDAARAKKLFDQRKSTQAPRSVRFVY